MVRKNSIVKDVFGAICIIVFGVISLVFGLSYINTLYVKLTFISVKIIQNAFIFIVNAACLFSFAYLQNQGSLIRKLAFLLIFLCFLTSFLFFYYDKSGLKNKISSVEEFRSFVETFGGFAAIVYIIFQFLQVVIIPVPSVITIGAGVLLFGPLKCAIYSYFGILLGSITAFLSGRFLGSKFVKWLLGEKTLEKGLNLIRGKDRVILTFMFLFPFFPDDALCFISGITKIKTKFFIIMISIVKLFTVFVAAFTINNSLIPFNTRWGMIFWVLLFVIMIFLTAFIYKKGDKIEKYLLRNKGKIKTVKHK